MAPNTLSRAALLFIIFSSIVTSKSVSCRAPISAVSCRYTCQCTCLGPNLFAALRSFYAMPLRLLYVRVIVIAPNEEAIRRIRRVSRLLHKKRTCFLKSVLKPVLTVNSKRSLKLPAVVKAKNNGQDQRGRDIKAIEMGEGMYDRVKLLKSSDAYL